MVLLLSACLHIIGDHKIRKSNVMYVLYMYVQYNTSALFVPLSNLSRAMIFYRVKMYIHMQNDMIKKYYSSSSPPPPLCASFIYLHAITTYTTSKFEFKLRV